MWQVDLGYSKWVDLGILFGMVVVYRLLFLGIIKIKEKVKLGYNQDEGKGFEADTTVSIALKEGTRDSEFFKQVQASLDKITTEERKQLMSEAVTRQPAGE